MAATLAAIFAQQPGKPPKRRFIFVTAIATPPVIWQRVVRATVWCMTATMDNRCATRVGTGCAMGGALGASIGLYMYTHVAKSFAPLYHYVTLQALRMGPSKPSDTRCADPFGSYHKFRARQSRPPNLLLDLQVPGIYKIRYVGQTTLSSAAVSGLSSVCSLQGVSITAS